MQKDVSYRKLKIRGGNNSTYDFSDYKTFKELFRDLYYKKMRINDVEYIQDEFNSNLGVLSNYTPKAQKYIEAKNKLLDNIKNFQKGTEKIIEGFKNGIFPLKSDDEFEEEARHEEEEKESKKESEKESDQSISNWVKVSEEIFNSIKQIINKNKDLGTTTDNKRYTLKDVNDLVDKIAKINIGKNKAIYFYNNLMNKAKPISELRFTLNRQKMLEIFNYLGEMFNVSKTNNEQPDTTDMSELENEESAAENQTLQICLNQEVKNLLLNKEEIKKEQT